MTSSRAARLKAQDHIRKAIAEYNECEASAATYEYDSGNVHTLSQQEITDGVVAFLLQCNIVAGSAGDIDLYRLIGTYVRDPAARQRVNRAIAVGGGVRSSDNQADSTH